MLDRHAVQASVRAKVTARAIATQLGVSLGTEREVAITNRDVPPPRREIGRPRVTEAIRARVRARSCSRTRSVHRVRSAACCATRESHSA
jgi:IS30 family transposase